MAVTGGRMATLTAPTRYRFTVDEYHLMGEVGIFHEDDRVELFEGAIITMTPIGLPHATCVSDQQHLLETGLGERAVVRVQQPIILGSDSEPQPDLVVARPPRSLYRIRHPGPSDIFLVIEVSDS